MIDEQGLEMIWIQWFRASWKQDVFNGPFAYPLARSLAPLTYLLAPHCSRAPLRSFVRSLARSLTHSGAYGKEVLSMKWMRRFHTVSAHCALQLLLHQRLDVERKWGGEAGRWEKERRGREKGKKRLGHEILWKRVDQLPPPCNQVVCLFILLLDSIL